MPEFRELFPLPDDGSEPPDTFHEGMAYTPEHLDDRGDINFYCSGCGTTLGQDLSEHHMKAHPLVVWCGRCRLRFRIPPD